MSNILDSKFGKVIKGFVVGLAVLGVTAVVSTIVKHRKMASVGTFTVDGEPQAQAPAQDAEPTDSCSKA